MVEPFVGSGAVFLNTDYQKYLLADINEDLIILYQYLQSEGPVKVKSNVNIGQSNYDKEQNQTDIQPKPDLIRRRYSFIRIMDHALEYIFFTDVLAGQCNERKNP